jgi:hypothetical protein
MEPNVAHQRLPKVAGDCASKRRDAYGNPLDVPCYVIIL